MPTFLVRKTFKIARQEGDKSDIVFTVPDLLPLTGKTARFGIFKTTGEEILIKNNCSIVGQIITVDLLANDLKGKSGVWVWELEVAQNSEPITIGKGEFEVIKENLK